MAIFKCKMCGGDLNIIEGENVYECEYCGSKQTVPTADNEKKMTLFTRANRLRFGCEFDKAASVYESIVAEFPEEAEAYWGLILCKYGIEYVDDPATGKKIPTCHRSSFESVMEDSNFEMVMEYSDLGTRPIYRDEAKEIERLRTGIIEVSSKEEPYDIFICYKETDPNGERTIDSVIAQDVYDALTEKGYRVFFSRITLEDKLGQEYEPYIFAALNSAKIMLAFGTDYEYFNAVWVKNEWSRFLQLIAKGEKKTLIPCFKGIDAFDIPKEFAKLQAQDMGKIGAIQDLLRGVDKIIGNTTKLHYTEKPLYTEITALIQRGNMALEDKDFKSADSFFERALDINPTSAEAYMGKLLLEYECSTLNELKEKLVVLENDTNFKRAIKFANEEFACKLLEVKKEINKNIQIKKLHSALKQGLNKQKQEENEIKLNLEAKSIYIQLVENLESADKVRATQLQLDSIRQKSCTLEKTIKDEMIRLENNKKNVISKTLEMNVKKQKIHELENDKRVVDDEISSSEKKLALLGVVAVFQKKELNQIIKHQNSKRNDIVEEIDILQKEADSLQAELEKLDTILEIERKIEEFKNEAEMSQQAVLEEIKQVEEKLDEEKRNGSRLLSFSEIESEIKTKEFVLNYIKKDKERLKTLASFSGMPINIRLLLGVNYFFGEYPQGANGERAPIEWVILSLKKEKALLISKDALDCREYISDLDNYERDNINWEKSDLRIWLNGTFLNDAFTDDEQKKIELSGVSGGRNLKSGRYPRYSSRIDQLRFADRDAGKPTEDRIFLLSVNDADLYFTNEKLRRCTPTAFAKTRGAKGTGIYVTARNEESCSWWLRSPGKYFCAALVRDDGGVCYTGELAKRQYAVRPALWINLDS